MCKRIVVITFGFVVDLLTLADLSEMEGVDMMDVYEGGGDSSPLLEGDNLRLRASIDCCIWAIRNSMISLSSLNRTPSKYAVLLFILILKFSTCTLCCMLSHIKLLWGTMSPIVGQTSHPKYCYLSFSLQSIFMLFKFKMNVNKKFKLIFF